MADIDEVLEIIHVSRAIAIVRLNDLSAAVDLSRALFAGGIRVLEFTLSNPEAIKAMAEVKAALPEFERGEAVIGIGTVLNAGQARAARRVFSCPEGISLWAARARTISARSRGLLRQSLSCPCSWR